MKSSRGFPAPCTLGNFLKIRSIGGGNADTGKWKIGFEASLVKDLEHVLRTRF